MAQSLWEGRCFWCGSYRNLEKHHIFGKENRDKSEKYRLYVAMCRQCHDKLHFSNESGERQLFMHQYGQRQAMIDNGWSIEDFRREFGKNYLDDEQMKMEDSQ